MITLARGGSGGGNVDADAARRRRRWEDAREHLVEREPRSACRGIDASLPRLGLSTKVSATSTPARVRAVHFNRAHAAKADCLNVSYAPADEESGRSLYVSMAGRGA